MKLPKIVDVELYEIIDNDFEGFLDILSDRTSSDNMLLTDISYRIVGHEGDTLKIEVNGTFFPEDS